MDSCFRTPQKLYQLKVDKFVCNKFGISEFLVSTIDNNNSFQKLKVLDVGCGVGPLGIYFADQRDAKVVGVEINGIACYCCADNINKYKLSNKFNIINVDFSVFCSFDNNKFDLIVSNPPIDNGIPLSTIEKYRNSSFLYIPDSKTFSYVTNSWHSTSGKDLLDYIFVYAGDHLYENGRIIIAFHSHNESDYFAIQKKGLSYGFSTMDVKVGKTTSECIGIKTAKQDLVSVICMIFKRKY